MNRAQLIETALAVREWAYAPYSNFRVGAAIETARGDVFAGCNVENASYGLTLCAERAAVCAAIAAGQREFVACAVATSRGAMPCGGCRQFLAEFANCLPILLIDADTGQLVAETDLTTLLPHAFHLRDDGGR